MSKGTSIKNRNQRGQIILAFIVLVSALGVGPMINVEETPLVVGPELREDCLSFAADNIMLQVAESRLLLTDGRTRVATFEDQAEAEQALAVIKYYNMSRHCFVGRPDPSMVYWLAEDSAPEGQMENEDCIRFSSNNIALIQDGGSWLMTDGNKRMKRFPNQDEAEQALDIMKQYEFTHTCYVGRPGPSFSYLRK